MTQIYSAIHNGTPVYELTVDDVLVARRAADSHINAAHILQIAGLSPSKRTRVIQKEIIPGTLTPELAWIPLDQCILLSRKYKVFDRIKPLLEYNPHNGIPKLKPLTSLIDSLKRKYISDKPFITPSQSPQKSGDYLLDFKKTINSPIPHTLKRPKTDSQESQESIQSLSLSSEECKFIILNIFIQSSHYTILHLLRDKQTREININVIIDKHGHSAIHYAAQLGDIKLLKCLIDEGGDVLLENHWGETALIRSITTSSNYNLKTFPETLELLQGCVFAVDNKRHTILHHLAFLGGQPNRFKEVAYYLECLSGSLVKSKLAILVGSKDRVGDTALHVACRMGAVKVIDLLLKMGARRDVMNLAQVTPDECIDVNSEAFRSLYPDGRQIRKNTSLPSPASSPQKEMRGIMTYLQNHFQRKAEEKVDAIHSYLAIELKNQDDIIKTQNLELFETRKQIAIEKRMGDELLSDAHAVNQLSIKKEMLDVGIENCMNVAEKSSTVGREAVELGIRLNSIMGKIGDLGKIGGGVYDELLSTVLECPVEDVEGIVKDVKGVL